MSAVLVVSNEPRRREVQHTLSWTPVAHIRTPLKGLGHRSSMVVSSLPGCVSSAQQVSKAGRGT